MRKSRLQLNKSLLKIFMLFIAVCSLFSSVYAQKTSSISGTIIQKNTQQALAGANINIAGTNLTTAADSNGRFSILNIPVKT